MNSDNNYIADVDKILEKHSDMVYKLALAKTGSNYDADDVFQEVFVKFMRHSHKTFDISGALREIRTPGLQVRSLLLYPAELPARSNLSL